jgi:hypothetical protein
MTSEAYSRASHDDAKISAATGVADRATASHGQNAATSPTADATAM